MAEIVMQVSDNGLCIHGSGRHLRSLLDLLYMNGLGEPHWQLITSEFDGYSAFKALMSELYAGKVIQLARGWVKDQAGSAYGEEESPEGSYLHLKGLPG